MINVLAGAYPDIFAGVAGFAGVPFGCFAGDSMWNSACANGQVSKTGAEWGDIARAGYPGYTGKRPKMQLWHGTNDATLSYNNFGEMVKQWTNVLGVSTTPTATLTNSPLSGWTRNSYGPNLQAISAQGVTHDIQVQAGDVISYFGLNTVGTGVPSTSSTPVVTSPASTTTAAAGTVAKWGQCAGNGWTGGKTSCNSGGFVTAGRLTDWIW